MRIDVKFVLRLCALVVLTRASQTKGQVSPLATVLTPVAARGLALGSDASVLPFSAGDQRQAAEPVSQASLGWVRTTDKPGGQLPGSGTEAVYRNGATPSVPHTPRLKTSQPGFVPTVRQLLTTTDNRSAIPGSPSFISTQNSYTQAATTNTNTNTILLAGKPFSTSTPGFTTPAWDGTPAQSFTGPRAEVVTPAHIPTPTTKPSSMPSASYSPVGPTHQKVPELNVGDDVFKGLHRHVNSPLDPLLAGLVSALIVTTAIISVVLFLKFRQRTDNPEFHRLQDLPMDDLMEDTPLSRYAY